MSFDIAKSKLFQNNFSLGCKVADFQLYTHVNDNTESEGSIYQKVNEKTETSINLHGWLAVISILASVLNTSWTVELFYLLK